MKFYKAMLMAAVMSLPLAQPLSAATPDHSLIVAQNINDIVALDPAQAYEFSSGELVSNMYDRLVQYDAEDTTVLAAGLASEWVTDEDAKTIRFTLRDDVKFNSGNPVRPEDVVFSLARVIKLNLTPAFILTQLGWTPENVDEMITIDNGQVVLKYDGDFSSAFVLNVLAARPASIVDEKTVMANEKDGDMGNAWLNTNSAGTGPFTLAAYRPGELVRLNANPDYFKGAPAMRSVIIRHVAESATQQLLLQSGDVDMARNMTADQVAGITSDELKVESFPQAAVHFLGFNQKTETLQPKAVWEAARYLVDYEGMANSLLKGQMVPHQAFWPKGFPGSYDEMPYSYDPEKAKQILKDAGIETPINVKLDVINSAPFADMAQSLQASFAEGGINFDIIPGTGSQVITKYRERSHEGVLLYWGPDFMDPHSNAKAFAYNRDNSDENYQATTAWRNAWEVPNDINDMTDKALSEPDAGKRTQLYIDLQKRVQEESPIVIMFQAAYQVPMNKKVNGYVNGAVSDFVYYRLVTKE